MKLAEVVKKILREEILKPHPAVYGGDSPDEGDGSIDTSQLYKISSHWSCKVGKTYIWDESKSAAKGDYSYPKSKVLCMGFEGDRGRLAIFKVLTGKYKNHYILLDALSHGKELI